MVSEDIQLSPADRKLIWDTIQYKMGPSDKDPNLVIEDDFGGDEISYLVAMAGHFGIPLGMRRSQLSIC